MFCMPFFAFLVVVEVVVVVVVVGPSSGVYTVDVCELYTVFEKNSHFVFWS